MYHKCRAEHKKPMNSPEAKSIIVNDGQHSLSASHPKVVDNALIDLVSKWHKQSKHSDSQIIDNKTLDKAVLFHHSPCLR